MIDMNPTIAPKSDQLNADDLIGGPRTIRITGVTRVDGDQPVAVSFEGDGGKPFKPCKSMRRVMVRVWKSDAKQYIGQSMTIYRDDTVRFGGVEVGGIRISHMTGIDSPVTMALTMAKASRKPYVVKPLTVAAAFDFDSFESEVETLLAGAVDAESLASSWEAMKPDRISARNADKGRAASLANTVTSHIETLNEQEPLT